MYQFVCLMFGLGPGSRIFTKLLKIPMSILRRIHVRILIYIDDMLIMNSSVDGCLQARDTVIYLLTALGFVINFPKSMMEPSQTMEFLGVLVDSLKMSLTIPQGKMNNLTTLCKKTLTSPRLTLRDLARLIGKLRATGPAFNPAPLQTRYLQQSLILAQKQRKSYESMVTLDNQAVAELEWWTLNMETMNGRSLLIAAPDLIISSDAAKLAWGAEGGETPTGGTWTAEERELHINVRETLAAAMALLTFTKHLHNRRVHLKVDNTTTLSYLSKMGGNRSVQLLEISKRVWSYLMSKKITLTLEYVPSALNVTADWESRNWRDSSE